MQSETLHETAIVFVQLRRLPSPDPHVTDEWQIQLIGAPCEGYDANSSDVLETCGLTDFIGGQPASRECLDLENKTFELRDENLKRLRAARKGHHGGKIVSDWNRISANVVYSSEFVTKLSILLTRGWFPKALCDQ